MLMGADAFCGPTAEEPAKSDHVRVVLPLGAPAAPTRRVVFIDEPNDDGMLYVDGEGTVQDLAREDPPTLLF